MNEDDEPNLAEMMDAEEQALADNAKLGSEAEEIDDADDEDEEVDDLESLAGMAGEDEEE